ncbi:MAG: TetR/AcrR family transcriptional regulator [Bryobacterales bacterium]|nr:TetR/AcrR family transcriptional regulator [Bryobacterales bacterium]
MARKRLTREESQARTRERLLDAALELFIKTGLDATSLEEVAEAAGYSRGAFYSNFASKDELIREVVKRETLRAHQELNAIFARELSPMERLAVIRAYYVHLGGDINYCMFWTAVRLYAMQNPSVRPKIAELLNAYYADVAKHVRSFFEELGKEPPAPPEVLAFSLLAQALGLALSRMVDPGLISEEQFQQALTIYFDGLIGI